MMEPTTVVAPSPSWENLTTPETPAVPVRTTTASFLAATTEKTPGRDAAVLTEELRRYRGSVWRFDRSIDRSTREPRDATTEASRRASEKRNHRASDSTLARLAGASDRPRVDGEKGSIDRSQSHHQPTIIHPSVETSDERRSPRTYRLHAHAAPQKCFLDASVAVEVLARADMFESDDGRGGVRSEGT